MLLIIGVVLLSRLFFIFVNKINDMEQTNNKSAIDEANELANAKAEELTKVHGCKVHPLVFVDEDNKPVIGYLKEPPRFVKLRALDKVYTNPMSAASDLLDAYLIKEESDNRIYSESSDNDKYYFGAVNEANNLIKLTINQFKKK